MSRRNIRAFSRVTSSNLGPEIRPTKCGKNGRKIAIKLMCFCFSTLASLSHNKAQTRLNGPKIPMNWATAPNQDLILFQLHSLQSSQQMYSLDCAWISTGAAPFSFQPFLPRYVHVTLLHHPLKVKATYHINQTIPRKPKGKQEKRLHRPLRHRWKKESPVA
jgi:hypothetical protein